MIATAERLAAGGTEYAFALRVLDSHMLMIYVFLLIVAALIASVGGLGLVTATSLNVLDRRRELGVLRAIGASPAAIAGIVVIESISIAALSWAAAVSAASALTALLGYGVGMMPVFRGQFAVRWPISGPASWLAIAVALSALASVVPALTASRRSIREAVAYE
jgi:putative ABC transport system permease protein